MPTSYTPLLGLALPVTGELAGTWGDVVSDYITKYLDAAVAGAQTISGSQTAVTLTTTNGTTLTQAGGAGVTGSAQYQIINCTGNPAGLLTITVPAQSKVYLVLNSTSTSQSVKVVGAGPTTGVTLVSGERALIAWNGSDFVKVASSEVDGVSTFSAGTTGLTPNSATSGAVTLGGTLATTNGGTGLTSFTTGDLLYASGSTALSKLGIGTTGQILTSTGTAPQWSTLSGVAVTTFSAGTTGFTPSVATSGAVTLAGTLATTNGGTGLTSFTANGVVYASSTSALTTGSALTFDGTNLTTKGIAPDLSNAYTLGTSSLKWNNVFTNALSDGTDQLIGSSGTVFRVGYGASWTAQSFAIGGSEQMRLTSTGLGIGTSSFSEKLTVAGAISTRGGNSVLFYRGDNTRFGSIYCDNDGLNIRQPLNDYIIFEKNDGTNLATLDSSGNLGLGVQPSAWGASKFAFQLGARASLYGANNLTVLGNNYYADAADNRYIATAAASDYYQSAGSHVWRTAASGTAGNIISFTQAMTLDASSRLGIGQTSPATNLHIGSGSSPENLGVTLSRGATSNFYLAYDGTKTFIAGTDSANDATKVGSLSSHPVILVTGNSERARITSGGDLLVGTTALFDVERVSIVAPSGSFRASYLKNDNTGVATQLLHNAATTGDNVFQAFGTEATFTTRGSISYNRGGGVVAYNTTSDYRSKDIIGPVANSGATIDALKVYMGKMKGATIERPMLIAHEAQEIAPYAVTGEKDAVNADGTPKYQQMDHQVLVPLLIAELQSLRARVAQLEAK